MSSQVLSFTWFLHIFLTNLSSTGRPHKISGGAAGYTALIYLLNDGGAITCSAVLTVPLSYLFRCPTCSTALSVPLPYLYHCPTCSTVLHVPLSYLYHCPTYSTVLSVPLSYLFRCPTWPTERFCCCLRKDRLMAMRASRSFPAQRNYSTVRWSLLSFCLRNHSQAAVSMIDRNDCFSAIILVYV